MIASICSKCGETMTPTDWLGKPTEDEFPEGEQCKCGHSLMIMWAEWHYISDQVSVINAGLTKETEIVLPWTKVCSFSATVYRGFTAIQTLMEDKDSIIIDDIVNVNKYHLFSKIVRRMGNLVGYYEPKVISAKLDREAGRIKLEWSKPPGDIYLVSSFEYHINAKRN